MPLCELHAGVAAVCSVELDEKHACMTIAETVINAARMIGLNIGVLFLFDYDARLRGADTK